MVELGKSGRTVGVGVVGRALALGRIRLVEVRNMQQPEVTYGRIR